ncbi:ATP-dependent DNA ligase [Streptomyces sp. 846.5]|nr:DNA ligase [Streptomyces sp. 846.5]TDT93316.1 ATP-dependent DNA ligase [Streptomyces sp. 846.5]
MATSDAPEPPVVLRPPVEVMRPTAVRSLPTGPTWIYQAKADGFRAVLFVLEGGRVVLQSRSGRNLASEFPDLTAALSQVLPVGTVLDGEICAADQTGRLVFTELLRSHRARQARKISVSYIAFDLLAVAGTDHRADPLNQRLDLLRNALADTGPIVQPVLGTRNRDEALLWYEQLVHHGIEGIVAKNGTSPYRATGASARRSWVKLRHAETDDAQVIGLAGALRRPEALVMELSDGRREMTSPRLDATQARQVTAAAGQLRDPRPDEQESDRIHWLATPLPAEVIVGSGRNGRVRFIRLRLPD